MWSRYTMKNKIVSILLVLLMSLPIFMTACAVIDDGFIIEETDGSAYTETNVGDESNNDTDTNDSNIESSAVARLADYMTEENYFDVQNFCIYSKTEISAVGDGADYIPTVAFSFIDLSERINTISATEPFVFRDDFKIDGYKADAANIDDCLNGIYSPSFVRIVQLEPDKQDFIGYGLAVESGQAFGLVPEHIVSFDFDVTDNSGNYTQTVKQVIYISAITANNTRYAFTEIYAVNADGSTGGLLYDLNMIVEADSQSLEFLNWDRYDWIDKRLVSFNIAFCERITLTASDYSATFELDNSQSDTSEFVHSAYLKVYAVDSSGVERTTFSSLNVVDRYGNLWHITATDVICYSSSREELTITTAYYDYNFMGIQVTAYSGYILCGDGSKVYTTTDEVRVVTADGETTYTRYDTNLFRKFYQTILYASFSSSCEMSDFEIETVVTDSNLLLTMEIADSTGGVKVYKFYRLTSSESYVTINGNGLFCVSNSRVNKILSDSRKFFANELIDAAAEN